MVKINSFSYKDNSKVLTEFGIFELIVPDENETRRFHYPILDWLNHSFFASLLTRNTLEKLEPQEHASGVQSKVWLSYELKGTTNIEPNPF